MRHIAVVKRQRRALLRPRLDPALKARSPWPRPFTSNHTLLHLTRLPSSRPQIPFLAPPSIGNRQQPLQRALGRLISTDTRNYIRDGTVLGVKYSLFAYVSLSLIGFSLWSWQGELAERAHPTPSEWSYWTRIAWRQAFILYSDELDKGKATDYARIGECYRKCIAYLEDPTMDGKDLVVTIKEGSRDKTVRGVGPVTLDVSQKSEEWKAGYCQAVILAGLASEHVRDMVYDRKQEMTFPKWTVVGPSNPRARKLPDNVKPPKEEDCEPAMPDPIMLYDRITAGVGFSAREKIRALHAHGNYLNFLNDVQGADEKYQQAMELAQAATGSAALVDDPAHASTNLLTASTRYATHLARTDRAQAALPLYLSSLLAIRHSDPSPTPSSLPPASASTDPNLWTRLTSKIFRPDVFPLPTTTGDEPVTTLPPRALSCIEAELRLYVGEILFSSTPSAAKAAQEGIAWTKRAVELAETALVEGRAEIKARLETRKSGADPALDLALEREERDRVERCKGCIRAALGNWAGMVGEVLAREEAAAAVGEERKGPWWWPSWGGGASGSAFGVAAAEEALEEVGRVRQRIINAGLAMYGEI